MSLDKAASLRSCTGWRSGLQGPGEGVGDGPVSENVNGLTGRRNPGETAGDEKSNEGADVAHVEAGECKYIGDEEVLMDC